MINSINISTIRDFCDKAGFTTKLDSDGDIAMRLSADSDFGHDVHIFFSVEDMKWLRIWGTSQLQIRKEQIKDVVMRINEYNRDTRYMKAYYNESKNWIVFERYELIDENVSEEFILNNFVKICPSQIWQAFTKKFGDL